jgi:hypothetical protein
MSFLLNLFGKKKPAATSSGNEVSNIVNEEHVAPSMPGPNKEPTLAQLSSPLFRNESDSSDDQTLVTEAYSLMSSHRFPEAAALISDGLLRCHRKDKLCLLMGNIRLAERDPIAVGWYMQACLLASPEWVPYLMASYAAEALDLPRLARRCLNACDVIDYHMKRLPDSARIIPDLLERADQSAFRLAMRNFETAMDPYLPASDALPAPTDSSRQIALYQNVMNDPSQPPNSLRIQLLGKRKQV